LQLEKTPSWNQERLTCWAWIESILISPVTSFVSSSLEFYNPFTALSSLMK
jgi:hypothetical protein